MKNTPKKAFTVLMVMALGLFINITFIACTASQKVSAKSGAQLWAENCQRCHNTPSPATFSPEKWETVGMHMQTRALITDEEKTKIVDFLKQ
ncbi:MAG TPA: cytochrome c [Chitinophagaceae bacterium]|jgi:cytochrome c2|nr:cytochrome c [Chitinophagaceae bacterium]